MHANEPAALVDPEGQLEQVLMLLDTFQKVFAGQEQELPATEVDPEGQSLQLLESSRQNLLPVQEQAVPDEVGLDPVAQVMQLFASFFQ